MIYKLIYLPLALHDLREITDYISETLKASKAAMDLLDLLDESISRLKQFPYSCRVYHPIKDLENEYRILLDKNYVVFYVVKEEVIEIHRIVYAKMDLKNVIK